MANSKGVYLFSFTSSDGQGSSVELGVGVLSGAISTQGLSSSLFSAPQGTGTSDKIFQFIFRVHSASGMGAELSIGAQ